MSIRIAGIDHFVLTVRDIDATCRFYEAACGMTVETFGEGRKALRFGRQKINLHQVGREFEPKARTPMAGAGDFCLIVETPLAQVIAHLAECGVSIEQGIVRRTGALGPIESIYLRDPDGNLVELSTYLG